MVKHDSSFYFLVWDALPTLFKQGNEMTILMHILIGAVIGALLTIGVGYISNNYYEDSK